MKRPKRAFGRRVALGVLALGLVGLTAWLVFNLTFPARTRTVQGTPYTLRVQPGVPEEDIRLVTDSLRLADGFFIRALGRTTTRPIDVKLARVSRCIPFVPLRVAGTAVADDDELCLNTPYGAWPAARHDRTLAVSIIAHEHFHNLQGQLGCLPSPGQHEYAWWVEGSATYVGWRTALHAGLTTGDGIEREMREWGEFRPDLRPLREYERAIHGDAAYALAARAVAGLVQRAGPRSLVTFCEAVGRGSAWRGAFERTFGVSADDFYRAFERQRAVRRRAPDP